MGGSKTQVISQPAPPAPSVSSGINDYVNALPALFQAQLNYAPQEAQQQLDLYKQYAGQYADLTKQFNETLNPGTSAIQEQLATQAQQGYNNGLSQDLRNLYSDQFRALAGDQVNSGLGADFVSKNLLQQDLAYRQYNQNLGLSLAQRQPLAQPQAPGFTNQLGQFNPGQVLNYNQGNYGSALSFSRPQVIPGQQNNILGGIAGGLTGLGAIGSGGGFKGIFG